VSYSGGLIKAASKMPATAVKLHSHLEGLATSIFASPSFSVFSSCSFEIFLRAGRHEIYSASLFGFPPSHSLFKTSRLRHLCTLTGENNIGVSHLQVQDDLSSLLLNDSFGPSNFSTTFFTICPLVLIARFFLSLCSSDSVSAAIAPLNSNRFFCFFFFFLLFLFQSLVSSRRSRVRCQ